MTSHQRNDSRLLDQMVPGSDAIGRRSALKTLAAALGAMVLRPTAGPAAEPRHPSVAQAATAAVPESRPSEPLFKISLAEWSLHRQLAAGQSDHLDFPRAARHDYGIEAVEYVSTFFKSAEAGYVGELKQRAAEAGVRSLLIMVDGEGALGDKDEGARRLAVENHYKWVDAARLLGGHSIRVNAYSSGSYDEQLGLVADGLRRLTEFAAERQLNVLVENHGGLSSNGAWVTALMKHVDHPRCGTLPDFGNFLPPAADDDMGYDRYAGVAEMMPYAKAVSAKSHDFDESGNEVEIDYRRMIGIVLRAGYHGHLGIEYEGLRLDEPEGIRATKRLLERVRDELA
jgi:L-ribulose-5-phosphate 3-epimerase